MHPGFKISMNFDALKGLLWGVALGDALGAPHEFTPYPKYSGRLEFPVIRVNRYQGRRVGVIGQVTDDTEMTIALADALLTVNRYDPDQAVKAYLAWANSGCAFMGRNTRALFHGVKTVNGYNRRFQNIYKLTSPYDWSQSNGCLMRCAPLAALGDAGVQAAAIDCALSNPHPVCIDACEIYVWAAVEIGRGKRVADVCAAAPAKAKTVEVRDVLKAVEARDVRKSKGWVLHALWCGFQALKKTTEEQSFEKTIDWVIRLGGDTDTNGCIAGGLLGVARGYNAMALEAQTGANIKTILGANPSLGELSSARPNHNYRPARLNELAGKLYDVFC